MKLRLILFILLSLTTDGIVAQIISGKVTDENKKPLLSASVILRSIQDSTYISGVATNAEGEFVLTAKQDKEYLLHISYLGYKNIDMICKPGNIGSISMETDSKFLSGTQVIASRIRHDANGYTAQLRASDITKGKQSSDALVFLPGISKEDGSYKINGLPVSDIYVDGVKVPSYDELGNIPADMIDKVKVNMLASSNQNAAMTGGTIEIFLRQPIDGGYYGSLTGEGTVYPAYGFSNEKTGGIVYGRYKNISIYDNLSLDFNQPQETAEQTIYDYLTDSATDIDEKIKYKGFGVRNRFSITQQINAKNTLGGSYYIATNRLKASSYTSSQNTSVLSTIENRNHYLDQEVTLKSTSAFTHGTTLECTGDFFNRHSSTKSGYFYGNMEHAKSEDKSSLNMYKFSIDLNTPLNRKAYLKYGASIQYIKSEYTPQETGGANSERFNTSHTDVRTDGLTPLAYVSAMGQIWKLMYSAGINFQFNRIIYKDLTNGTTSTSNQFGINPQIQMMMPLDKSGKNAFMLNYRRTLDDIPYAAISSVISWSDSYNYTVGNPDLKSPSADMVMAGLSLLHNTINVTALYVHSRNNIYWTTRQSDDAADVFYTMPVNLPGNDMYGLGAELNCKPAKPWNMKLSCRFELHPEDITLNGFVYRNTRLRQYYTIYNTYNFEHGWGGMLNMILEPTFKSYDRTYHTVYNVGGQIYKSMCKDKLQLTLMFNAVGKRRIYDRRTNNYKITYNNNTSVQIIGLSLTWRFSGGKNANIKAIDNAAQGYKEIIDAK